MKTSRKLKTIQSTSDMKAKLCKFEGCDKETVNFPNSTIRKKYCQNHAILIALNKIKEDKAKDKAELDKVRETVKKGSPVDRFYHTMAWINFKHYALLFYADENLEVVCSTDPTIWGKITDSNICLGHFIKVFDTNSTNYSTAFEFKNVGPQSKKENDNGGNMPEMARWIETTHGHGTVEELKAMKRLPFKLDKYTLDEIAKKYLNLFNELLKGRNIRNPWINRY